MLGLSVVVATFAPACAPAESADDAPAETEDDSSPGVSTGTLVVYTLRFDDDTSQTQYFLRTRDTYERRLYFEKDPGLSPGIRLRVSGQATNDGLRVATYQVAETVAATGQALINAAPYKPRRFGFVLVDIGGGINLTKAEAEKRLFGTNPGDKSVKQYYNEVSYGTQDITGEVLGPLTHRMTGCDTRGVATTLKMQVGTYDHYLWYFGSRNSSCAWSGLAESGQPSRPTNDTWYNGSANCVVLVQEPGHNFGMMHSSSMTCGTAVFADDPEATCKHSEYGDRYDPMGGSCNHMNAWQKVFEGWLQQCNAVRVRSSGMYTLQPLELACDGPQVLQIPMPKVRPFGRSGGGGMATVENIQYYYLELRTARGFDDTIRSAPTVLVRVAEDFRSRAERGRHTWILDMDPTTPRTIEGLVAGKSYTDPAGGVSFQVVSISPDSASIQVTIPGGTGGPTCLDQAAYDPAVPRGCAGLVVAGSGDAGATITDAGLASEAAVARPTRVEALMLVNADTDMDIAAVDDGEVLDLSQLPPNLTLRVDTDPSTVGSVAIRIDGGDARTDSSAPYSISSDDGRGNFTPWTLALGAHTVRATPYDAADGGGKEGEALEIDFTLTRGGAAGPDAGGSDASTGSALDSGTVMMMNPVIGADGGAGGFGDAAVPTERGDVASGCGCQVPGAATGAAGTLRLWAMAALALGLFARRRRSR